jgi:hypothetical protein
METLRDGHGGAERAWVADGQNPRRDTMGSDMERVPASTFRRIGTKIAALGFVVGINALIIGGGGMIEAGADGLLSPGYSRTRSWFVLGLGTLAWLAFAVVVIVVVRSAKRHQP